MGITPFPAPCRFCGGPSWREDDTGPVHPCCHDMWTERDGCLACRSSAILNRDQRRRARKHLPQQIIDDKLVVVGDGKSIQDQEAR